MVKPNNQERRAHPRISVNVPLQGDSGSDQVASYLKDISRAGAAVIVSAPMKEMSLVFVEAVLGGGELPRVELSEEALVVRCRQTEPDRWELGLFFHTMREETRDAIDYYIDQALLLSV